MEFDEKMFFLLIRLGLETYKDDEDDSIGIGSYDKDCTDSHWEEIFNIGVKHGIAAIQFQGLEYIYRNTTLYRGELPNKQLKLKWYAYACQVEKRCEKYIMVASELANLYAKHRIRTVILKGIAVGINYPQPNYRSCGDLDCYLCGDYKRGNVIVKDTGASVDDHSYKHSHIEYKGLTIENHQFCTPISGSRRMKRFERLLQHLLLTEGTTAICNTHLECPSPMFNALFLTHHAQRHFLSEGITLRHLCDWAMFVDKQGGLIDWKQFKSYCEEFGLWLFAESMTVLSERLLNVRIPNEIVAKDDERDNYLLHEIRNGISRHSSSHSLWRQRLSIVKDIFNSRKRYKVFSDMSYFQYICQLAYGYCFDRNPHI